MVTDRETGTRKENERDLKGKEGDILFLRSEVRDKKEGSKSEILSQEIKTL